MGKRRKGREVVLQALYASLVGETPLARALEDQLARRETGDESALFARALARQVEAELARTDRWLARLVEHWAPERLGCVERSLLRLALTELRHSPDVPPRVVIDEACELARRFCDEGAVGFVNGVLDKAWAETVAENGGAPPGAGPARGKGGA